MDPRYARSQRALRDAALTLAAAAPLQSISVSEVCRAAGITRDTFYRHAPSPVELVAVTLGDGLAEAIGRHDPLSGLEAFRAAERSLLQHVADHVDVYRNAMEPQLLAPLRANLERTIHATLRTHLDQHPQSVPAGVDAADEGALDIVASYAAAGTVGAVERWIHTDPLDVDRGVAVIIAASPEFWFA